MKLYKNLFIKWKYSLILKNKPKINKSAKLIIYISYLNKNKDLKKNINIRKKDIININNRKIRINSINVNIIKIKIDFNININ